METATKKVFPKLREGRERKQRLYSRFKYIPTHGNFELAIIINLSLLLPFLLSSSSYKTRLLALAAAPSFSRPGCFFTPLS
ncbi:hypothetical protein QN277_027523 [Acacia crassicarpa]|uniref:Uncharacterized protein n=1 Tax=Acacia crassicarpa TaxID=499986 RepID=A0AAE1MM29_9FABA|nr:hypothetical protein QN277_027523 [Acacia crassicarpa]